MKAGCNSGRDIQPDGFGHCEFWRKHIDMAMADGIEILVLVISLAKHIHRQYACRIDVADAVALPDIFADAVVCAQR